jgi:sec-independent protein translocase protein TatB
MFDIAWSELLVIGAVALVAIPPKDLPKALRTMGEMVGKVRRMASEFQGQFNDAMRDADLQDIKKTVEGLGDEVKTATKMDFNPIQTIRDEIKTATESKDIAKAASAMSEADAAAQAALDAKLAAIPLPDMPADPYIAAPVAEVAPKPKRARKAKIAEGSANT